MKWLVQIKLKLTLMLQKDRLVSLPSVFGFSSLDGALGNIGIKESNLFGEAKELGLNLGLSTRKSEIDLSYTDPYFLNRDLAAGIDIFNVRRNQKTYSGYKHNIIGFKLRTGFEIIDNLRHFSSYTLKGTKNT